MLQTRWEPFNNLWGQLNRFHEEMNQLFDNFSQEKRGWPALAGAYPAINLWQDADKVYAEAEVPGMNLEGLEIYVTGGNQLVIKGERKPQEFGQSTWLRQERGFGQFTRVLSLPVTVDADKVEATLANGVLTLTLPKSEEAKPRKIIVKVD